MKEVVCFECGNIFGRNNFIFQVYSQKRKGVITEYLVDQVDAEGEELLA